MKEREFSTEQGAKMIIDLQGLSGVEEPAQRAIDAWNGFSERERKTTVWAHQTFCPKAHEML